MKYILKILKENPQGLTTNDIKILVSKNIGANFSFHEISRKLDRLRSDLLIEEIFDDEVSYENYWYLTDDGKDVII